MAQALNAAAGQPGAVPRSLAPYQVQSVYAVPDGKVSRLAPNAQLPVAASAQNPMMLAVDWDALF